MAKQDINEQRFKILSERTKSGEAYINYLFTLTGNYSQLVKVFTGIATGILALPFLSLKTVLVILKSCEQCRVWAYCSWSALGLAILIGAYYQLNSIQIVEEEVEMRGRLYETYLNRLRWGFYAMMIALMAGIFCTIVYLLIYVDEPNADLSKL